jgi:hypothetical protein
MDDGRELPLIKLETTSETHPFYTGTQKSVDSLGGRVEKFRNKFASASRSSRAAAPTRQLRLPFLLGARRLGHHEPREPPTPALVTQRRAALPRLALLLLCAAYLLPGLFGRDPWRHADITAFGYMLGHGRRPHRLAVAHAGRHGRPTPRCCRTGSARPSSSCCRR